MPQNIVAIQNFTSVEPSFFHHLHSSPSSPSRAQNYWLAIKMALVAYCMFCRVTQSDPCMCVSRSGSRTVVPKRGAWSSWARWAPGGTRFSGARGGWGRWWTDWSPGSSSPTGPSLTMEVCVPFSSFCKTNVRFLSRPQFFIFFFPHCEISNFMF